jgi:hypothetical protein
MNPPCSPQITSEGWQFSILMRRVPPERWIVKMKTGSSREVAGSICGAFTYRTVVEDQ